MEKKEKKYALIKNGIVENMIIWDGLSDYAPPKDCIIIEVKKTEVGIGWLFEKNKFLAPKKA